MGRRDEQIPDPHGVREGDHGHPDLRVARDEPHQACVYGCVHGDQRVRERLAAEPGGRDEPTHRRPGARAGRVADVCGAPRSHQPLPQIQEGLEIARLGRADRAHFRMLRPA